MQFITKDFLFRKIEMSLQRGILLHKVPETKISPEMVEEDDPGPGARPPPQRRADPLLSTLALEFGAAHSLIGFVVISRKKSPQESPPITPRLMHITSRGNLAHHRPILRYTREV